jgi:hypothetical protein
VYGVHQVSWLKVQQFIHRSGRSNIYTRTDCGLTLSALGSVDRQAAAGSVDLSGKPFANAEATEKSVFPLALFDSAGAGAGAAGLLDKATAEKLMREENVKDSGGQAKINRDFNVVVTTHFRCEDLDEHFFGEDAPRLPPGKFQPMWVQHEDGTDVME